MELLIGERAAAENSSRAGLLPGPGGTLSRQTITNICIRGI